MGWMIPIFDTYGCSESSRAQLLFGDQYVARHNYLIEAEWRKICHHYPAKLEIRRTKHKDWVVVLLCEKKMTSKQFTELQRKAQSEFNHALQQVPRAL